MDQRAEQLDGLRHAFRKLADLLVDRMAEPVAFEQFAPAAAALFHGQAAQGAHEADCLVALHRGVQAALFGQIADPAGDFVRALVPEDAPHAFVGIDDAEQHPQRGRLARAVRTQNAVDRAFGDGYVDPVHRQRPVEPLDETARLDCKWGRAGVVGSRDGVGLGKHDRELTARSEREQQQVWLRPRLLRPCSRN